MGISWKTQIWKSNCVGLWALGEQGLTSVFLPLRTYMLRECKYITVVVFQGKLEVFGVVSFPLNWSGFLLSKRFCWTLPLVLCLPSVTDHQDRVAKQDTQQPRIWWATGWCYHAITISTVSYMRRTHYSDAASGGSSLNHWLRVLTKNKHLVLSRTEQSRAWGWPGTEGAAGLSLRNSLSHVSRGSPGMGPKVVRDSHPQGCPNSPGHSPSQPSAALALLGAGLG